MKPYDAELDAALAPLRDGEAQGPTPAEAAARRQRLLPYVQSEVARVPGRLRRRRAARYASMAAGCAAALGMLVWMAEGDGNPVGQGAPASSTAGSELWRVDPRTGSAVTWMSSSGVSKRIAAQTALQSAGELHAGRASADLFTEDDAHVRLQAGTRVRLSDKRRPRDTGIELVRGEVRCRIGRPKAGRRFAVDTPDARVVVHGTVFRVRVQPNRTPQTCVRVSEGRVRVTHESGARWLDAGASWGCPEHDGDREHLKPSDFVPPAVSAPAAPPSQAESTAKRTRRAAARQPGSGPTLDGTLEEENRLLGAALAAERAEQRSRARTLYQKLLTRFPDSPIVPEARAGLRRTGGSSTE